MKEPKKDKILILKSSKGFLKTDDNCFMMAVVKPNREDNLTRP